MAFRTSALCLAVALSALYPCPAARTGLQATMSTITQGLCDGAYVIPNFLVKNEFAQDSWKYGIPPGAKVTIKQVFSSSLKWLEGKSGIVVTTDSWDGHGLVPTHLDHRLGQVCEFQGKVFFPGVPIGGLGQKNRNLGKFKGEPVSGIDMGGKVIVTDVVLPPAKLEEVIDQGFKVTGPILDDTFKKKVVPEVLLEAATLAPDSELLTTVKPIIATLMKPMDLLDAVVVEPPLEAATLTPDSELLSAVKPIIATLIEPMETQDTKVVQAMKLEPLLEPLHIVPVGKLQPAQELILDTVVRDIAKPAPRTVELTTHKKVWEHCGTERQKLKCCWQKCSSNFPVDEQGECLRICKSASGI